ncbi:MAG: aldehyde ferredoxin oxidoreductase family protein [Proteobacteria bacterium]|nr:aldehyde ferredoxin oxidoreductase family protein [Pseudomonadota bacterium]
MKKGGYHGRYLTIDLTNKSWQVKDLPEELANGYLGGRGIGGKLLYDLQPGKVDPLSPDNHLIAFTGPLTGTHAPGSSRITFMCKSPLTNTINMSSMGGAFPNAFKRTGFDGVVISGKSKSPVWIHITPEGVQFNPADDLWGRTTSETETAIREKVGEKCRVACIGPAGENQVLFSAVVSETRTAARGGNGTVMGSKNLKAIAVSGDHELTIADKQSFKEIVQKIRESQNENMGVASLQMNGTAGVVSVSNAMGILPTKNFQTGTWEAAEETSGAAIAEKIRIKSMACASCPVGCSLISEIKTGKFAGTKIEGPEYESTVMLGSNLLISDLNMIAAANHLCDEFGLDTISTGNVIGFAMECYERGLLTDKDTGGLALTWGNGDLVLSLIEMIALKQGFGKRLAQGVARLSKEIPGSEGFAMQVKGMEIAAYDPRGVNGQGLSYAISPRGGDHGKGGYMIVEVFMPGSDLYTYVGKAAKAAHMANNGAILDSGSFCNFNFIPDDLVPGLLTAIVGEEYSEARLRNIANRIINLERRFNIREGFSRKDDTLPARLLKEPLPEGMAEGKTVTGLDIMIDEYYEIRGWNKEGNPPEL